MKFTVMSRFAARDYTYSTEEKKSYIMVSINDKGYLPNMFARDFNMHASCFVYFDDVEGNTKASMQTEDAEKILTMVDDFIDEIDEIVVHCGAGVSRSAGVCAAIMKILTNNDTQIFENHKYRPNMHCYRTVLDAYFGSYANSDFIPKKYRRIDDYRKYHM